MFDAKVRHKLIPCFLIIADDDPLSLGDTIDVQSNAINMDVSENVNTASICSEDSDADLDFDEVSARNLYGKILIRECLGKVRHFPRLL